MSQLKLYNYFRSSTSYRVRLALEYKNLPYEYAPIHLLKKEQNSDSYRALNPMGGVPTLEHEGRLISQSFAIIEYLDEVFPQTPRLFSTDVFLRAKIKQACEIINADTHPLHNLKVMQALEDNFKPSEEQKQQWMNRWISDGLTAFAKTIQPFAGRYCFGENVTAADLFLVPQMFTARRFKVDLSPYSFLNQIDQNCTQLETFKKAHPMRQPDTPEEMRIK